MSDVLIQLSIVDGDLGNFYANAPAGITRFGCPSFQKLTTRQWASVINNLQGGGRLYIVAHGDGTLWGSAGPTTTFKAKDCVDLLCTKLPHGCVVQMCICNSDPNARYMKQTRPDLTVIGYAGTPQLSWKDKKVSDASGNENQY